jgi:dienelactone hydrolase
MCVGVEDRVVTSEQREAFQIEMREAGVADWRVDIYGGTDHSFTNLQSEVPGVPRSSYNPTADRRSWRAMLDLFRDTLG